MSTLLRGGQVHSRAVRGATALLVEGDVVAWLGTEDGADQLSATETVQLDGAWVAPAFVDAHVHATATGLALTGLDLSGATSLADALDALAAHAAARPGDAVLLGTGWDEAGWPERRAPTAIELDRATGGRATYLARADLHSAVANAALGGAGLVRLDEHHAVRARALASVGPAQTRDAQRATRARAAALGVGCLHEMGGPEVSSADDLAGLLTLAAEEGGPEVLAWWGELGGHATAAALGAQPGGDLFLDGSLGSHTAALSQPYRDLGADDEAPCGVLRHDLEAITAHVVAATRAGQQAGFHAIGDAALDTVLRAMERAAEQLGLAAVVHARHRLEHAELLDSGLIARCARLGAVASVQPAFDARWAEGMYVDRLGAARAARTNPFAALVAAGVPLALGSDAPVTPLDPWGALRAATRPAADPAHALSGRAAFAAHTRGGWRAARLDGGELAPGSDATFAVWQTAGELVVVAPDSRVAGWSTDPRSGTPGLPALHTPDGPAPDPLCLRTVVRGRTIHQLEGAPA